VPKFTQQLNISVLSPTPANSFALRLEPLTSTYLPSQCCQAGATYRITLILKMDDIGVSGLDLQDSLEFVSFTIICRA
jgi:hypothetical protein